MSTLKLTKDVLKTLNSKSPEHCDLYTEIKTYFNTSHQLEILCYTEEDVKNYLSFLKVLEKNKEVTFFKTWYKTFASSILQITEKADFDHFVKKLTDRVNKAAKKASYAFIQMNYTSLNYCWTSAYGNKIKMSDLMKITVLEKEITEIKKSGNLFPKTVNESIDDVITNLEKYVALQEETSALSF